MNESEIKKGRKKYNKLQREKEYYLNKKKKLEELKNDPKVQQYLETVKFLGRHNDKEYETNNIISKSFGNLADKTEDSSNILVFLGFKDDCDNVTIHSKKIDYASFMDLETMEPCNVHPEYYEGFCKDRNIIYFDDPYKYHNSEYYMKKFFELRNMYLGSLNYLDQDKAIEEVLKR